MTEDRSEQSVARGVTRRQVLGAGAAGGALLAAGMVFPEVAEASPDRRHKGRGTTLERTLLRGQPGVGGYRPIVAGPGEPHLIRDDLVGNTPRNSYDHGRAIAAFGQLTDMHILDAQSPARVEFLDRYNDPGSPFASLLPLQSSWRPQENADGAGCRGHGASDQRGAARAGHRAAPRVHDQHRRQRRQHPAQRTALADRSARRPYGPS